MSNIIDFPSQNEREWIPMEAMLREDYKKMPDGPASLEECLPDIRAHWHEIFAPSSLQVPYDIPGSITEEQSVAIRGAVEKGLQIMKDRLDKERARHFALLVMCEYKAAFYRRNSGGV